MSRAAIIAVLSLLPQAVFSYPSSSAFEACKDIESAGNLETKILFTALLEHDYLRAKGHYRSAANADLYSPCVAFPESAKDVSDIMSVLLNYTDVNFAVKSGGHNPNVCFSNVDGGVLISMSKLASTTLSNDKETADIGPGARWNEALAVRIPQGKALVGGLLGKSDSSDDHAFSECCRRCWCWWIHFRRRIEFSEYPVWYGL